jgi:AcrR family transcriptional regulator
MAAVTNKQRKAETRNRLLDAAFALISERGYEDATLDAIAERAGSHVQTLYRHFPSKSELANELWHRSLNEFEAYFTARKKDAFSTWRDWIELTVREPSHTINALAGRNSPPISSRVLEYWARYQQVLAECLAEDFGLDVASDIRPTLIACMLWGGNQKVALSWVDKRRDEKKIIASLVEVVDTTQVLFETALTEEDPTRKNVV